MVQGVPRRLTYAIPERVIEVSVGSQVIVEVGRRQTQGWVVGTLSEAEAEQQNNERARDQSSESPQLSLIPTDTPKNRPRILKEIHEAFPAFHADQLQLFEWMAHYYGVPLAEIIANAVPRRVDGKKLLYAQLTESARDRLEADPNWIATVAARAPVKEKLLRMLLESDLPLELPLLMIAGKSARTALRALEKAALVTIGDEDTLFEPLPTSSATQSDLDIARALTASQSSALEKISSALDSRTFSPIALYGVTGSGKTEVYIRAIQKVLREGGSALVIVPEIALTPQLLDQFESRLGEPLALLHSQVGAGTKWNTWSKLLKGSIRVALGARSSVFAPLNDLRLIIVDEEHESSYKQSDGLRYHGRDVAVMRGKFSGATVLLGSATPSFETVMNAARGRYQMIEMPMRVTSRPLPEIEVVDLNRVRRSDMPSENISPALHAAMQETLERKGQIVILYNKRGFSSYLQCGSCNTVVSCEHCSVALTYHKGRNKLLCHYCNTTKEPPTHCQFCRDPKTSRLLNDEDLDAKAREHAEAYGLLSPRGAGTEKVVDEIATLFPEARIVRMDRDTVGTKSAYKDILGSMRSGTADILVGTQMIAKGHDLPGVTLVGVINADVGLHIPDFRSSEKVFQLITQAAGRAGRGTEQGRVIMQTREPNHPTIIATVTGRFKAFARYELEYRKTLNYPPYGRLLRLVISSPDAHEAAHAARITREACEQAISCLQQLDVEEGETVTTVPALRILGPAPAPHERLRGRYRWHILVKARSARTISQFAMMLSAWKTSVKGYNDFRMTIDVDPVDML